MMLYRILLVCFIVGSCFAGINELGWYTAELPASGATMTAAQVEETGSGVSDAGVNPLFLFMALVIFIKVLLLALSCMLSIVPMFVYYIGWEYAAIALILDAPLQFVKIWGLYQFVTGHQTQGMD